MKNDQQPTHQTGGHSPNDEIDLIELCKGLWEEKTTIITCVVISSLITVAYLIFARPVYTASIELTAPSESALNKLTPIVSEASSNSFLYTPDAPLRQQQELLDLIQRNKPKTTYEAQSDKFAGNAFAIFLSTLASGTQVKRLIQRQADLLTQALNIDINSDGVINTINQLRIIEYPNTLKKNNELKPDSYFLTYEGYDREALKRLIANDATTASTFTISLIKESYIGQLTKTLKSHTRQQKVEIESIKQRIEARKSFLRKSYQAKLTQLKEQIYVAKTIKNNDDAILLSAELENLKQRDNNTFFDDDLFAMQAQRQLLTDQTYAVQLQSEIDLLQKPSPDIQFSNEIIIAPEASIKPEKKFIAALGIILGGLIGLLIALTRYIYKSHKKEKGKRGLRQDSSP
jgi:chain length determinant protein (polysaccharide antigen chain regulator)